MMREKYESLPLSELRQVAKARGLKGISTLRKDELVARMVAEDEKEKTEKTDKTDKEENGTAERSVQRFEKRERTDSAERHERAEKNEKYDTGKPRLGTDGEDHPKTDFQALDSGQEAVGILEVLADGYGFIRSDNFLPGENDVYVSPSQIRRFGLKTGDILRGNTRIKSQNEKFSALLYVKSINGMSPSESSRRCNFEDMTPVFPNERIHLERPGRQPRHADCRSGESHRQRAERNDCVSAESGKDYPVKRCGQVDSPE